MAQSVYVQLLAIGTMAVCMLLLGTTVLLWNNAREVTRTWGVDVPVTVYLVDDADAREVEDLADTLREIPEVAVVERITPDMALDRLVRGLGQDSLVGEIDPETLPDSLEVYLHPGVRPGVGTRLADHIREHDVVEEVAVLGPWVQQAEDMLATLRRLATGVGVLVTLACLAIVWSTIRLGVFARRAEIHILRLVGGTPAFVRGPFLVEGWMQGTFGAGLALSLLHWGFDLLRPHLDHGLSLMFAAGQIRFFSELEIVAGLVFGGLIGVLGSRAAVDRFGET